MEPSVVGAPTTAVKVAVRRVAPRVGLQGLALALTYVWMIVTAAIPAPGAFLAGTALSYVAEWWFCRNGWRNKLLGSYRLPTAHRFVLREMFAVVLLLRMAPDALIAAAATVCAVVAIQLLRGGYTGLRRLETTWRSCRFGWRNIAADTLPDEWPRTQVRGLRVFSKDVPRTLLHADIPLVLGISLIGVGALPLGTVPYLAVASTVLAMILPVAIVVQLPRIRRLPSEAQVLGRLRAAVERYAPVVMVYFSGPTGNTYPINVWLPTLERSRQPTLIIVREKYHLSKVGDTRLPIIVLPTAEDVVAMHVPTLRAALYPTNVMKNNDMLRLAGIRDAFIGHGDSDKIGSANPMSRVYDEIWVAGEANRDRYIRAKEGVRPDQIELVGRPQLAEIERAVPEVQPPDGTVTVLYAPTWEGFWEQADYSSLLRMGEEVVRQLLELPQVRVLFKKHPATGTRSRSYRGAAARISASVRNAGDESRVVDDTEGLYAAFNHADLLITDISSVSTDFLYSGKPLIVTNPKGRDDESFVKEFPSSEAAYRIGPDSDGLEHAIGQALGPDPLRDTRLRVRDYLLGNPEGDPVERFLDAVDRLVERSHDPSPAGGLRRLSVLSEERASVGVEDGTRKASTSAGQDDGWADGDDRSDDQSESNGTPQAAEDGSGPVEDSPQEVQ